MVSLHPACKSKKYVRSLVVVLNRPCLPTCCSDVCLAPVSCSNWKIQYTFKTTDSMLAYAQIVASVVTSGKESQVQQANMETEPVHKTRHSPIDVLVCAIGRSQLLQERLKILKNLWDAGIAAETPYDRSPQSSVQDMQVITGAVRVWSSWWWNQM